MLSNRVNVYKPAVDHFPNGNLDGKPVFALSVAVIVVLGLAVLVSSVSRASVSTQVDVAHFAQSRELSPTQLKQNALTVLRQYETVTDVPGQIVRVQKIQRNELFNVNTFLLASRVGNASKLAELQMQTLIGETNADHFSVAPKHENAQGSDLNKRFLGQFAGIGFPHIETSARAQHERYKPYRQLVNVVEGDEQNIVPHIACMGLSPRRVAARAQQYESLIIELAVRHRVSASLVKAVVSKESCFNASAKSRAGAIGLMQLMPETARWLNVKQPENAAQNLAAGVRYLAQLKKRFGTNELALAAYNAGPGNVERYQGIPPFVETQNYVRDVMHFYRGYVATTRYVNALNDF